MAQELTPEEIPESGYFTVDIHPVPFPGVSKDEQFERAEAFAQQLSKIEGFATVTIKPISRRPGVILNTVDPIITAAIITAIGAPTVSAFFKVLRERREKKDLRETIVFFQDCTFQINDQNEATMQKAIEKLVKKSKEK